MGHIVDLQGWTKRTLYGLGIAALIVAFILMIAVVVTVVSASGYVTMPSWAPNARAVMGESYAWSAAGLGLLAALAVGAAGGALVAVGGAGRKSAVEQNLTALAGPGAGIGREVAESTGLAAQETK